MEKKFEKLRERESKTHLQQTTTSKAKANKKGSFKYVNLIA